MPERSFDPGKEFGEPLVEAFPVEHPKLYYPESNPNLIVREGYAWTDQEYETFSRELDLLESSYGIRTAGLSLARRKKSLGDRFIVANKIDGVALTDLKGIEKDVAVRAMQEIIRYYEDAFEQNRAYMSDLSLRQLMYGKAEGDAEDHLYFVDMEPAVVDPAEPRDKSRVALSQLEDLEVDLNEMTKAYGEQFDSLRGRLLKLAQDYT